MTPLVSIIIPVYNASSYITHCLESIEVQTIRNIEVILVDDHGKDDTMQVAESFAEKSRRKDIQYVFTQTLKNSGPGIARNEGLKYAKGEYLAFADADDWMEPEMYEKLYLLASKRRADVAICNACRHEPQGITNIKNPIYRSSRQYLAHYVGHLWTYIFRRDFIERNGLQFPSANSAEDSYFIATAIMMTNNVVQCSNSLYHYIVYPTSISHQKNHERYQQKLRVFSDLIQFARKKGVLSSYRWVLYWVYFKKAIITSVSDYIASITAK